MANNSPPSITDNNSSINFHKQDGSVKLYTSSVSVAGPGHADFTNLRVVFTVDTVSGALELPPPAQAGDYGTSTTFTSSTGSNPVTYTLEFLGAGTTQQNVLNALQALQYTDSNRHPPANVHIDALVKFNNDVNSSTNAMDLSINRNDAPVAVDTTVQANANANHVFQLSDFNFSDADDVPQDATIRILSLPDPVNGALLWDGNAVTDLTTYINVELAVPVSQLSRLNFAWASQPVPSLTLNYAVSDSLGANSGNAHLNIQYHYPPDLHGFSTVSFQAGDTTVALAPSGTAEDPNYGSNVAGYENTELQVHLRRNAQVDAGDAITTLGNLSLSASNVLLGAVVVGTYTSASASDLVIRFGSGITKSDVQAVIHQLAFSTTHRSGPAVDVQWTMTEAGSGAGVLSTTVHSQMDLLNTTASAGAASGTATQGQTLTAPVATTAANGQTQAGAGELIDLDGLQNPSISYRWFHDDNNGVYSSIPGANQSTYVLQAADVGHHVKVRMNFVDQSGFNESVFSVPSASVGIANNPPTGAVSWAPAVQGLASLDATLGVTNSAQDIDANKPYYYEWFRNGTSLPAASQANDPNHNASYALVPADEGASITVRLHYTDQSNNAKQLDGSSAITVNHRPSVAHTEVRVDRGADYAFRAIDVDASDADGAAGLGIQFVSRPNGGDLLWRDANGNLTPVFLLSEDSRVVYLLSDIPSHLVFRASSDSQNRATDAFVIRASDGIDTTLATGYADVAVGYYGNYPAPPDFGSNPNGAGSAPPSVDPPVVQIVPDPPAAPAVALFDGLAVTFSTTQSSNGSADVRIEVPAPTPSRVDDPRTLTHEYADVPLVGGTTPMVRDLVLSLSNGIRASVDGPSDSLVTQSLVDLVLQRADERFPPGSTQHQELAGRLNDFLAAFNSGAPLNMREVTLSSSDAANYSGKVMLTGDPAAAGQTRSIILLDARNMDVAPDITLKGVDCVIVFGRANVLSNDGRYFLLGDEASQYMSVGAGNDVASGGPGEDTVDGGSGADTVDGGYGNDMVIGGTGNDVVSGAAGNDVLEGGRSDSGSWRFYLDSHGQLKAQFDAAVHGIGEAAAPTETLAAAALNLRAPELAFLGQDPLRALDIALLFHAAKGEMPSLQSLGRLANGSLSLDAFAGVFADALGKGLDDRAFAAQLAKSAFGAAESDARVASWTAYLKSHAEAGDADARASLLKSIAFSQGHLDTLQSTAGTLLAADTHAGERGWLAGSGNDLLWGGPGNDTLAGGDGVDAARFNGGVANFSVQRDGADSYHVNDKSGADGNDSLNGIEQLRFADQTVNLMITDAARSIDSADLRDLMGMYIGFFHRAPEADGLLFWIQQRAAGKGMDWIAQAYYDRALEFGAFSGFDSGMSDEGYAALGLRNVLGREASDAEVAQWAATARTDGRAGMLLELVQAAAARTDEAGQLFAHRLEFAADFAVRQGLGYVAPEQILGQTAALSGAVTADGMAPAVTLLGIAPDAIQLGLPALDKT